MRKTVELKGVIYDVYDLEKEKFDKNNKPLVLGECNGLQLIKSSKNYKGERNQKYLEELGAHGKLISGKYILLMNDKGEQIFFEKPSDNSEINWLENEHLL